MKEKRLLPLFLSQSLRSTAISLLSFFSAIYIFKCGLEITGSQKQAFLIVFSFYLILYICKIIAICWAEDFSSQFGLKTQVLAGNFFTSLAIFSFYLSASSLPILWLAAVYWGLAIGFFWFGRHGMMVKFCSPGRYGHALGTSLSVETLFLLIIPFLGGLIITEFGYKSLFISALVFTLLALLTSFSLKNQKTHHDVAVKDVLNLLWAHKRMTAAYLSSGIIGTIYSEGLILYIFLNIKKELKLGIFFTLSLILVAAVNFLICNLIDQKNKKDFIGYGTILNSLAWWGRFLSNTYGLLFVFDILGRISGGMAGYPLEILSYEKAVDGGSTGRAILFREFAITAGSILAIILLGVIIFLGLPLKSAFLVAAFIALAKLLILKKDGVLGDPV